MAEIDVHTDTHTRTEHWQRIYDSNDDGIAFNPPSFSVNVFLLWRVICIRYCPLLTSILKRMFLNIDQFLDE